MSLPPLSEPHTLPVTPLGIKNFLFKLLKKPNLEHLLVDQQQQSILFQKLPQEMRTIIWQYVLGGKKIEFIQYPVVICRSERFMLYDTEDRYCPIIQMDDGSHGIDRWMPKLCHVTGLLKTCRLVRDEAIDELYGCNRFMLDPRSFWAASMEIMPHHFAQLRQIYFHMNFYREDREFWTHLCKTIAGMTNLRTVHMRLSSTSKTYHDDHEEQRSGGLRHFSQKFFGSPKKPVPISEEFILNSLYRIEQVRNFEVQLDARCRSKGFKVPVGHSNAPFKLICEYTEDVNARIEKEEQEQRERRLIKQQQEDEERRLEKAQRKADRLRFELEQKAQEIVQSYQSFAR